MPMNIIRASPAIIVLHIKVHAMTVVCIRYSECVRKAGVARP